MFVDLQLLSASESSGMGNEKVDCCDYGDVHTLKNFSEGNGMLSGEFEVSVY